MLIRIEPAQKIGLKTARIKICKEVTWESHDPGKDLHISGTIMSLGISQTISPSSVTTKGLEKGRSV